MTSRMFPFITVTCNPLAGGPCPFQCSYWWATKLKNRHNWIKYTGPWRIHDKALKVFHSYDFLFACDMVDIGAPDIPPTVFYDLMAWIFHQPCQVLTLTKNPEVYRKYHEIIPKNMVLGATIESDLMLVTREFSKAPKPHDRLEPMQWLAVNMPNDRFISVEPIMKFSPLFSCEILSVRPWAVAVGYDNYRNGLIEPSLQETKQLISELSESTKVFTKTLRESLPSTQQDSIRCEKT